MSKSKNGLLLLTVVLTAFLLSNGLAPEAVAEQAGSFSGNWTASGQRQPFDFVEGREVGTFKLAGNVSLKEKFAGIEDFWAECVGLSDSVAGSSVRCVWRSLNGEKAYSVLNGQPLKEGVEVTGEFVGGSESLKGLTGTFNFTWTSTFTDKNQDIFTGHTQNLKGTYKIP